MILPCYVFLSRLFFLLLAINYFLSSLMMTLNHFEFDSKNGFNLLQIECRHVYIVSLKCWFQKERYKFYNLCLKSVLKKGINVDLDLIKLQSATHRIMKNRRYQYKYMERYKLPYFHLYLELYRFYSFINNMHT